MFENLDIFQMSTALAKHAGHRQALVAQNVANADTPGYVSRDIRAFEAVFNVDAMTNTQKATRAMHLNGNSGAQSPPDFTKIKGGAGPNGNEVSLETEMLRSVDAKRQHDRALAIYKSGLGILRSNLRTT